MLTLTGAGEAIGFVRAVRDTGLPAAVGFTVETDGRLPDGTSLADAIARVDAAAPPDYYIVNCAHPTHVAPALDGDGPWSRIEGLRPNASRMSHAELDEVPELDEGDPADLRTGADRLRERLPNLRDRRRLLRHRQPPRRRAVGVSATPRLPAGLSGGGRRLRRGRARRAVRRHHRRTRAVLPRRHHRLVRRLRRQRAVRDLRRGPGDHLGLWGRIGAHVRWRGTVAALLLLIPLAEALLWLFPSGLSVSARDRLVGGLVVARRPQRGARQSRRGPG